MRFIRYRCLNEISRYNNPFPYYIEVFSQILSSALRSKLPLIKDKQVAVVSNQHPKLLKNELYISK